jgi:hypothetical protein
LFFKVTGAIADKYPAYITIPCSFLFRALSILLFVRIGNPKSVLSYLVTVIMVMASFMENTTLDGVFTKNLPKDIRGALNGIYAFFGTIGILVFS